MTQCTGGHIEDNTITDAYTGVEYYYDSTAYTDSLKIYGNEFTDVNIGIFAATTELAVNNDISTNTYTNVIPIKTECNEFDGSEIGIAGCGNWLPQGGRWISSIPRSAGNRFISTTIGNAVLEHTSQIEYRWSLSENTGGEKDPKPIIKDLSVTINNETISDISGADNQFKSWQSPGNPKYYLNPGCPSQEPSMSNGIIDLGNTFLIYPNPSNNQFIIENILSKEFTFKLYSAEGRFILDGNSRNNLFFGEQLVSGVYVLKIKVNDESFIKKIIKQ